MLFDRRITRHHGVFSHFFHVIDVLRHASYIFSSSNLFLDTQSHCWWSNSPLSTQRPSSPLSPSGHLPPILLEVKLSPLCPAIIPPRCWWPTSPLPTHGSSSTHSGGRETRNARRETVDGRQKTGDKRRREVTRDDERRREMRDQRQETRDKRPETRDQRPAPMTR